MADDGTGGGNADGDKGGDDDKGDAGDDKAGDKKDDKKADTEGRITVLAREKKELEDKLALIEKEKKDAADAKLLEDGKLQELLDGKTKELDTLTGEHTTAKQKLEAYEADAKARIANALKAITDKEQNATMTAMLDGKPIEEQIKMLPQLLSLVGTKSTDFGGGTPESKKTPDAANQDTKQKRFDELLVKAAAGTLTPQERQEKDKLAKELSEFLNKS